MGNATYTDASFQEAVKISWPQSKLTKLMIQECPTVALIPIVPFKGRSMSLVVQTGMQVGRSAVFATAQTNRVGSQAALFSLVTRKDYAVGGIDGETLEAIEDDESLIDGINDEMEGSFDIIKVSVGDAVHGDGSGAIGQISTDDSATQFTLTSKYDSIKFFKGQVIQANPTRTGTVGNMRAGTGTVTGINTETGAITYTANSGFNPSASDYIYTEGDYDAKIIGLEGWNPETVTSTAFFGLDRTSLPDVLAGHRFDASAMNPIEGINKALAHATYLRCAPTVLVINPMEMHSVREDLGSKAVFDMIKSPNDPSVTINTVVFMQGNRKVHLVEDVYAPRGVVRGFDPKDIAIYARKKGFPRILNRDGNTMRAEAAADAYQWRLGYYAQMGCKKPKNLFRIKIATVS